MKKIITLFLTFALCLLSCSCSKKSISSEQVDSTVTTSTEYTANLCDPLKDAIGGIEWNLLGQFDTVPVVTMRSGEISENGYICGTWDVINDTLVLTYYEDTLTGNASKPQSYQIKEHNRIYFLIGSNTIYCSVSPAQIPVTEIEITLDNWQTYFETDTVSTTVRTTNSSGEVSVSTTERQVLKLKTAYHCKLNPNVSSIHARSSSMSDPQYMEYYSIPQQIEIININIPIYRDWTYFYGVDAWEDNGKMIYIQGSLAFIDGL